MKLFISPSSQAGNLYAYGSTTEKNVMNIVADIICADLKLNGIDFMRNDPTKTYANHVTASNLYVPDFHIALHTNASGQGSLSTVKGCTVYCAYPQDVTKNGTIMARAIYKYLEPLNPWGSHGILDGRATMSEIRDTHAPAILVEAEYHDNLDGAKFILTHVHDISLAILYGIYTVIGVRYTTPVPYVPTAGAINLINGAVNDLSSVTMKLNAASKALNPPL
jgi:N-acetylmuramoyl-L-alanine amidase